MPSPRSILKARLAEGETIVAPGAYDPIGARVVRDLGFTAIYTGGYMTGAHLAVTEPLMTMTEQVEVARRVASSVELPVIVDAVMPRGVKAKPDLATFRKGVPDVPLLVIAGADDISVAEYADLGYQIIIYATTPIVATVDALLNVYQRLRDTGVDRHKRRRGRGEEDEGRGADRAARLLQD